MIGIDWNKFTVEERHKMQPFIDAGDRENIVCCINPLNMTLEKEIEIQKMVDQMTPDDEAFESEVEDEVERDFMEGVRDTDKTPEMEAEAQEKLDAEREEYIEKKRGRKKKEIVSPANTEVKNEETKESSFDKLIKK